MIYNNAKNVSEEAYFKVNIKFEICILMSRESWLLYFNVFLMSCDCCSVALPHSTLGWSAISDCDTS